MNKKLTKLLSVFLIAGLIGTGTAVGVAGCKKDNSTKPTNNQTEQDITWNMKDHGTKPSDAAAKTSGGKVTKPAVDPTDADYDFGGWFSDEACTTAFDFTKTYSNAVTVYAKWTPKGQENPPEDGINLTKEWTKADYDAALDNNSKKWLENGSEIVAGVTLAGGDFEMDSNSKKIYVGGADKSVGYRVKFGADLFTNKDAEGDVAAYKQFKKGLKVEVEEDATLVLYGTSGSGNSTAYLSLAEGVTEGEGAEAVTKLTIVDTQQICWKNSDMNAVIFELKAGKTYYVGSDTITKSDANAKNANIYYLELKSNFDENKGEKVAVSSATCEDQGVKVAHYYTGYGRYLDEEGEALNPEAVFEAATGHKWTYTTVTAPDATTAGSVALTCGNDSTHTKTVTLPALKTSVYTRTPITEGENAGKCTYTFKCDDVYSGETKVDVITFVADTVSEAKTEYVDIAGIEWEEGKGEDISSVGAAEAIGNGTVKIAAGTKNGNEMGASKDLNAAFTDGTINMKDQHSTDTLYAVIGFDEAKTSGAYRVSGKFNAVEAGSWDPIQIVTSTDLTGDQDSKILFALSSNGSKKYCMRFGTGDRGNDSDLAVNTSDKYYFRLDVDLDNHIASLSLSLNGTEWTEIRSVTDEAVNTFAGVRFQTAGGSRSFSVEQIAISQKMEVDAAVGNYTAIEGQYSLNEAGTANNFAYALSDSTTLDVKVDETFVVLTNGVKMTGTWEKGDEYYTAKITKQEMGEQSMDVDMTAYIVLDEAKGIVFMYGNFEGGNKTVAELMAGAPQMAFLINGADLYTEAVYAALETKSYGFAEPGEWENPKVIEELSATAITATEVKAGREGQVYYYYKNTGDAQVTITVVASENTVVEKWTKSTTEANTWNTEVINASFSVAAGETILISVAAKTAGDTSFVFRAYDPSTDGAVNYDITLNTNGVNVECPAKLKTNEDGTLGDKLPTLQNTATAEFNGWKLADGTPVDGDTVFDENTEIFADWTITAITFEQKTYTYNFEKITGVAEKGAVTQAALDGTQNAFLKAVNENGNAVVYRAPTNSRIEVTKGGLQVYFGEAGGTLTLNVKSTGNGNDSLLALKNENGDCIAASAKASTIEEVTQAALDGAGIKVKGSSAQVDLTADAIGSYVVRNGDVVEITFTVTEEGWYTIYSDNTLTTRGICVMGISQTVNAYSVPEADFTATSVELSETAITVNEQESATVTANIATNLGVYATGITWSSENTEVATVEDGVINVLKKGECDSVEITCTVIDSLGNTVSKKVTVTINHVAATGVSITTEADDTLKVDDTKQLEYAVAVDGEGTATDVKKVEWKSSDPHIATVDENGLVTVVGAGTANITVEVYTLGGGEETAAFTSEAYAISITAIAAEGISLADATVKVGRTATLTPTVTPAGASGYTVEYEISTEDQAYATVNATTGVVTGKAAGTATVTATLKIGDETIDTATCTVTVAEPTSADYAWAKDGDSNNAAYATSAGPNSSQDSPPVSGLKLDGTKYDDLVEQNFEQLTATNTLTLTASGFKATVAATGFTIGSGNASEYLYITAFDSEGNALKTIKLSTPKDKKKGDYTGDTFVLEMDEGVEFASIKLYCGVSGKAASLVTVSITVLS